MKTEEVYDAQTGLWIEETEHVLEPEAESWSEFAWKVALTPFAVVLDVITYSVQECAFGIDEDEARRHGHEDPEAVRCARERLHQD